MLRSHGRLRTKGASDGYADMIAGLGVELWERLVVAQELCYKESRDVSDNYCKLTGRPHERPELFACHVVLCPQPCG